LITKSEIKLTFIKEQKKEPITILVLFQDC